jgi:glycerol-3-phosphate cytidylyltransferase-like family protein
MIFPDCDDDLAADTLIALAEEQANGRAKTKSIIWDEQREHILAAIVLKHKAYKKTKGDKKEDKWERVKRDVFRMAAFNSFTPIDLSKKWERMVKYVKAKFALEEEGANLSGLPENLPSSVHLVYQMTVEVMQTQLEAREATEKEKARNHAMLTHEENVLAMQGNENDSLSSSQPEKRAKTGSSPGSTSSVSSNDSFKDEIMSCLRLPQEIIDAQVEDIKKRAQLDERRLRLDEAMMTLLAKLVDKEEKKTEGKESV